MNTRLNIFHIKLNTFSFVFSSHKILTSFSPKSHIFDFKFSTATFDFNYLSFFLLQINNSCCLPEMSEDTSIELLTVKPIGHKILLGLLIFLVLAATLSICLSRRSLDTIANSNGANQARKTSSSQNGPLVK